MRGCTKQKKMSRELKEKKVVRTDIARDRHATARYITWHVLPSCFSRSQLTLLSDKTLTVPKLLSFSSCSSSIRLWARTLVATRRYLNSTAKSTADNKDTPDTLFCIVSVYHIVLCCLSAQCRWLTLQCHLSLSCHSSQSLLLAALPPLFLTYSNENHSAIL